MKRLLVSILIAIASVLLITLPVLAIANPATIAFTSSGAGRYKVFENVYETGDMLFVAESYINYDPAPGTPTDYMASEAFSFQLLNAAGDTTILQTAITEFEDTVISIYQTAAQVIANADLVSGTLYNFRLIGNPSIFGAGIEGTNMATKPLTADDWLDQSEYDGTDSWLYVFCIAVVSNIEASSGAVHAVEVGGITYLDASGATLFLAGIPALNVFLPEIFLTVAAPMTATDPASTGAYQTALTPLAQLGGSTAASVDSMADWLSVSSTTAGIVISAILGFVLLPVIYLKTQNGTISMIAASFFTVICGYLGLFPLAIAFIIAGVILILTGFLFWGRISI